MDQSRRQFLKLIAAAPLVVPFGLSASPLLRYLKPTTSPLGFFDPADQPGCAEILGFTMNDFPQPWTCIPFMFPLKISAFNPEQFEVREIPAFIIRTEGNEIVAYSRVCRMHSYRCFLTYMPEPRQECGCGRKKGRQCCCAIDVDNPVLMCPCNLSTFDLANNGRVIRGPAVRAPRAFELEKRKDMIVVVRPEPGEIVG
jgi:Rieske Fe-S protein